MLLPVKINIKKLEDAVALNIATIEQYRGCGTAEYIARQSMYLGRMDDYYLYMLKAVEWVDVLISNTIKNAKPCQVSQIAKAYHLKANYLRLLAIESESEKNYKIAKEYYEKALPNNFEIDMNSVTDIRTLNAYIDVLFFLKEYEKCAQLGNSLGKHEFLASKVARAIINGNNVSMLEDVANTVVRQQRTVHIGTESMVTSGQWDWYEICLQLLGLPSKLDEIKAYKEQHGL